MIEFIFFVPSAIKWEIDIVTISISNRSWSRAKMTIHAHPVVIYQLPRTIDISNSTLYTLLETKPLFDYDGSNGESSPANGYRRCSYRWRLVLASTVISILSLLLGTQLIVLYLSYVLGHEGVLWFLYHFLPIFAESLNQLWSEWQPLMFLLSGCKV